MKRDMDLVRRILLEIESEEYEFVTNILYGRDGKEIAEISDLKRHLEIMTSAGLIETTPTPQDGQLGIIGITWQGNDFLDTIRDPEAWRKTKEGASKIGAAGFGLIAELAKGYVKGELQKLGVPIG
jgi:hypothetical protein